MKHGADIRTIVNPGDVSYLDDLLLDDRKLLKAIPAKDLAPIPHDHLLTWATDHGVYQFVTTELIDFLQNEISGCSSLEICAGHGTIARTLNIVGTDSYHHCRPETKLYYQLVGQQITEPPPEIMKFDANAAVDFFKPEVVIGAFVSQHITDEEYFSGKVNGAVTGTKEINFVSKVKKYINIGNANTHRGKKIYALPHKELYFDWLYSKAFDQKLNRVWVWDNTN